MATILKSAERQFQEAPGKPEPFRVELDASITKKEIVPENLNFDVRRLHPGHYSSPYHFHRYAEELFMIVSGSATLRTTDGLHQVTSGDLLFFEKGPSGAHQLFNHTTEPCVFLDIRSYIGYDVCEYPDSGKILLVPSFETFDQKSRVDYFDGEEHIRDKWEEIRHSQQ